MIASARMYSWSPSLLAAWQRLLRWVGERSGAPFDVLDPSAEPASLDDLWARPDMACVFMCGYPWARSERAAASAGRAGAVAAALRRSARRTSSDFIVRADGPDSRTLADTFGGTIAYLHRALALRLQCAALPPPALPDARRAPSSTATVLGPFVRQRPVIDAVLDGRADVAAVDGYGLDLLRRHEPALVAPPARGRDHGAGAERRRSSPRRASTSPRASASTAALLSVHEAPAMATTLDELLLTRFVRVEPEVFEVFLERERAAEAAGYAKLG